MAKRKNAKRSTVQQRVHDLVIEALAGQYSRRGYVVHANPNQQKNHSVAGMYPDLVVMAKSARRPLLVVEVETEDSVRESEAARQKAMRTARRRSDQRTRFQPEERLPVDRHS